MCSEAILPSLNSTTATVGASTLFPVGGDARQHPIHLRGVGEAQDQLVNHPLLAYRAREEGDLGVRGFLGMKYSE
jgi:hypothetical protein